MRILRAAERAATPWKNGGGLTREIAAWPPGAGFEDFLWRVSMAEVHEDGPFSIFPGVDRHLAVLEGRLRLAVEGFPSRELSAGAPPATFPGDAPTYAEVRHGPVLDLNVMSRRGKVQARLTREALHRKQRLRFGHAPTLVVAAAGGVRLTDNTGSVFDLEPHDAVLVPEGAPGVFLQGLAPATAYVASFVLA